jgi:hypothetical protein
MVIHPDNIELLRQFSDCIDEIAARGGLRDVLKRAQQERQAVVVGFGSAPTPPDKGGADAG